MAKKQLSAGAKDLLSRLKKTSSIEESGVFSDSELYTIKESVPTPIPIINLALSGKFFDGGITKGSTVIAGASRSFKTVFGLLCLKAYMDRYEEAVGMIYDSEFSMTPEYLKTFDIDTDRVFISPIADLDKLKNDIINQIDAVESGDRVFILIDSIGNLASLKEISDAQDGKSTQDMTRAKMMKSFFRMITPRVNLKNIPLFTINHVYESMCLSGDTTLMTPNGFKKIQDFAIGDLVESINGPQKVIDVIGPDRLDTEDKEFLELEFNDGTILRCTHDHKFLMEDGTWKQAKDIEINENFKIG